MNIDETTLIEIQDYISNLDEKVGLKPETMVDIRNAISKYKRELKNLRLGVVVGSLPIYSDESRMNECAISMGRKLNEGKQ